MKVFRGLPNADARRPCALTIGNFDGVHLGHQALLTQVGTVARALGIESAVMTFEPHPREFFAQLAGDSSQEPPRVVNLRDKLQALHTAGINRVIVEHFNTRFAAISAEDFIQKLLVDGLHVKYLIVGDDFRFGAKRSGDFHMLVESGKQYGFEVSSVATVTHKNSRISSSAVRASLKDGDFIQAKNLLGYAYSISGHVQHGRKLGRTLGFPTLNIRIGHRHPVLNGIFVVQVHGLDTKPLPAVASLGVRPTVEDDGRMLLEVHIFDFNANCYGKLVRIEFLQKLRDEEKYTALETLTDAIAADARAARDFFEIPSIT